jgi:hypothetical protein
LRLAALSLCALPLLAPRPARAQGADTAARRALVAQAQEASRVGNHALAIDLGQRAALVQMTPSLRAFLAGEYRAVGQYAPALEQAELCLREVEAQPSLRNRDTVLGICREVSQDVRPRVGQLVVRVPVPTPSGLVVNLNGHPLNPAFYGVPYIVTPGSVAVEVAAPGFATFRQSVGVRQGETAQLPVTLRPETTATALPHAHRRRRRRRRARACPSDPSCSSARRAPA